VLTVAAITSKIDVITLFVDGLPRAKAFYLDVFELPAQYEGRVYQTTSDWFSDLARRI
jgi:hypothetical protein